MIKGAGYILKLYTAPLLAITWDKPHGKIYARGHASGRDQYA